ncbi:tetratricopeptide repeat protein [Streptomyces sp. NPDC001793]|uniref:tetratricopeptide repeat protein n=1 Tax=Streptomyces sp. NPDC001793 TaxID=3154657 RepID=UPI0033304D6F
MDDELMRLAASGAAAVVQAVGTDAWTGLRHRLAEVFRRSEAGDASSLLDAANALPPGSPEASLATDSLEARLRALLRSDPDAAAELRTLMAELPPSASSGGFAATRNTVSGGTTHGPVIQAGAISTLTIQAHGFHNAVPDPENWPAADDLDPIAFGVRPADRVPGRAVLPPYVLRDCDADIDVALVRARSAGGLVLLLGEPFTGKTRTALAAMADGLRGFQVFAPARGADLRGLPALLHGRPGRYAVWLDDLDGYLNDADGGLEPRLLAQLKALRVVVVATLREDAYDACRAEPRGRVLDVAHTVELAREWSPAERGQILVEYDDPRLEDALRSSGPAGVPAYLALSPLLRDEWWRARRADRHPRGHALVRAALDLARCGLTGPLSMDLLLKVHEGYADVTGMERESAEDALAWATERRYGLLRLLDRVTGDTWRAAPILVEAAARHEELPDVPGPVWGCALEVARTDEAYDYAEVAAKARVAFQRAADAGDTSALHNLGLLAESLGEGEEAERWFRRAAEAGEPQSAGRLGRMLAERGEGKAAEPFLEAAAEAGDAEAAVLLGKLLRARAEHWFTAGAKAGNPEAAHLLGDLRLGKGDVHGAFDSYLEAAADRYEPVARNMGVIHLLWHEGKVADVWMRRAAASGDECAAGYLAPLTVDTVERAVNFFQDEAERGRGLDAANLGTLLETYGRPVAARTWYLKGYKDGDAYGAFRLAELCQKTGDEAEAAAWYRKAAALGHPGARRALGEAP